MRRIFLDEAQNNQFLKQGYVVTNLLDIESCDHMRSECQKIHGHNSLDSFFTTTHSPDISYRKKCNETITNTIYRAAKDLFDDYSPLYGNFMIKPVGDRSECNLHQDWTVVDEKNYRTVNVWVALQDIDVDNGCIHVIPASQRLPFPVRGRNIFRAFEDAVKEMIDHLMIPVLLKKGDAIIFDSAILHYSPVNRSDTPRIAVSLMLYPSEAPLHHYVYDKKMPEQISRYKVDQDFFVEYGSAENYVSANGEIMVATYDKMDYMTIQKLLNNIN